MKSDIALKRHLLEDFNEEKIRTNGQTTPAISTVWQISITDRETTWLREVGKEVLPSYSVVSIGGENGSPVFCVGEALDPNSLPRIQDGTFQIALIKLTASASSHEFLP